MTKSIYLSCANKDEISLLVATDWIEVEGNSVLPRAR
jgi:hypothetical protein